MTTVLVADDHQLVRQALRRALDDAGLNVVSEACDGEEAVRLAKQLEPDVVVMDVTMPILDGIQATRQIYAAEPDTKIVILTMHGEDKLVCEAIDAGAVAFLSKDCSMQEVVETVRLTSTGEVFLSPALADSMLKEFTPAEEADRRRAGRARRRSRSARRRSSSRWPTGSRPPRSPRTSSSARRR